MAVLNMFQKVKLCSRNQKKYHENDSTENLNRDIETIKDLRFRLEKYIFHEKYTTRTQQHCEITDERINRLSDS